RILPIVSIQITPGCSSPKRPDDGTTGVVKFGRCLPRIPGQFCTLINSFVSITLDTATKGSVHQVLGSFFFGRENVIPTMFHSLLAHWHIDEKEAPMFVYYLNRHIELNGDSHGPAAWKIINELAGDDPLAIEQLKSAAEEAIHARHDLWDGLAEQLRNNHQPAKIGSF
ncbi:MAG: DUF3050 domain-containing protein, partial [Sulfurimicrobium sp.]|nr:DUF3050 domain-containing protein [Sulfurimicrobium sp.]